MKHGFHEGFLAKARDPVDAQAQGFDWEALYLRLGEDARDGDNDQRLVEAVVRLLQLLVPEQAEPRSPRMVGLRVIALAWVLNPAYFAGSPSLHELARRCGTTPATLARYTGEASRLIGWRNRAQGHAWNWRARQRSSVG